jgi:hypothetical protein
VAQGCQQRSLSGSLVLSNVTPACSGGHHLCGAVSLLLFSPLRECKQRIGAGHAQRLEMLEIAGEQQQASVLGQCCDGHVGKAGVAAFCHGGIR